MRGLCQEFWIRALHSTNPDPQYAYLHDEERARISNILTQTHSEFRHALEQ